MRVYTILPQRHWRDVAGAAHAATVFVEHDEGLIDRTVVGVGEHQDLGPTRGEAHQAQEPAVRVGRRKTERPLGEPEAARQFRGDPLGVLVGHHGRHAAVDPDSAESLLAASRLGDWRLAGATVYVSRARTSAFGEWPAKAPVSPSAKSTRS